jgi:two-component system sensor histidine kinase BaeS
MYLYQQEFGLTELRLYTTVFMLWISTVLIWFVLTVLRARRDLFAFGALLAGFAAIFAINAMNPDAFIASTNIERMEEGKRFDAYYLTTLSADAVPVLVESLPEIGDTHMWTGYTVEEAIVDRWSSKQIDWRTWNLDRSRARQSIEGYLDTQSEAAAMMTGADSRHQDKALLHPTDRVIHKMLWIRYPNRGISESSVTSG